MVVVMVEVGYGCSYSCSYSRVWYAVRNGMVTYDDIGIIKLLPNKR